MKEPLLHDTFLIIIEKEYPRLAKKYHYIYNQIISDLEIFSIITQKDLEKILLDHSYNSLLDFIKKNEQLHDLWML